MKALLCSVPVEGVNEKLDRERWEGPLGISPQIAIISIIKWMEKNGYSRSNYDFFDKDKEPNGKEIRIAATVEDIKIHIDKKNQPMGFFKLDCLGGKAERTSGQRRRGIRGRRSRLGQVNLL